MKALVRSKYGSPKVLGIEDIEMPSPSENRVLVKVFATTVNRTDLGILYGTPYILRIFTGLFKPNLVVTGSDFAGQIVAIGENVKSFKVGDRVMGFGGVGARSHAEYLTFDENRGMITIPENISYEEAAACIEGAFYALNCIKSVNPKPGQKAVVNGGTGAIGSVMVQFLKYYGIYVTAVCGNEYMSLVKSLGADKVIDYKKDDFTKDNEAYDFVFDAVGKSSFSKCKPLLNKNGIYIPSDKFVNLFLALVTHIFGGKKVVFIPPKNLVESLNVIKEIIEKGSFKPVIDRKYSFDKIVEAYNYVETGEKIGNVIITMDV